MLLIKLFAVGVQWETSAFGCRPHRMLTGVHRFSKLDVVGHNQCIVTQATATFAERWTSVNTWSGLYRKVQVLQYSIAAVHIFKPEYWRGWLFNSVTYKDITYYVVPVNKYFVLLVITRFVTEGRGRVVNTSASYSAGPRVNLGPETGYPV
jgi:hypothetical protein